MLSILYNIIISPIELVVEVVFEVMFLIVGGRSANQGIAVIGVSLAISLLTLPLYRRADAIQRGEYERRKRMSGMVSRIRAVFSGDERFMMLSAYYREQGYSPVLALKGSVSLLLEIPFFIAAYHFLSHLELLHGASFCIIRDLGEPDGLVCLNGHSFNLLPIFMTAINCISAAVYLKGFALKDKIQTYGMSIIFLVLLYNSPSGLVVYWICNNIFSLVKNIFYRLAHPLRDVFVVCAIFGTILTTVAFRAGIINTRNKQLVIIVFQTVTILPVLCMIVRSCLRRCPKILGQFTSKGRVGKKIHSENPSGIAFFLSGIFISLLLGILIPSALIASSPAEFIEIQNYRNPLHFLLNSVCYAFGFFVFWAGIVFRMLDEKRKSFLNLLFWLLSGMFIITYMFFGKNLGVLSPLLVFEDGLSFSKRECIVNLAVLFCACGFLFFLFRIKRLLSSAYVVLIMCVSILSVMQIRKTQSLLGSMSYVQDVQNRETMESVIPLSKNGKNVVVFMLDRAISGYIPYLFAEKPILERQFAGFTYYPNTVSFGFHTNFGTPALFGGYEYTVSEMNKRENELLADKHNEALKMLPALFSRSGFDVTVCDPPYAGYKWIPDLSIFENMPGVKAHILSGNIDDNSQLCADNKEEILRRNFFCYSLFKVSPLVFAKILYDYGNYYSSASLSVKNGFYYEFSVLSMLPKLTAIRNDGNTFLSIANCATHDPCMLQLPDYVMRNRIDNSAFKTFADGHIGMEEKNQIVHYHANMASLLALGNWFDFMRENGVWDNTKIILVADHGRGLAQFDYMLMKNPEIDVEWCNPLLMVKDFGASEFTTSAEFMTNADVPVLATDNVIENPVNPFTGKKIDNVEKNAHPQLITSSNHLDVLKYNGTVFDTSDGHWFSVHDDIFREENWKQID